MQGESNELIERDGDWFIGWSFDVPGANGQGCSVEECRKSIAEAIKLILEDRNDLPRKIDPL